VRIITFSIDPRNDTPAVLAEYAKTHSAGQHWLFLTGERSVTSRVANEGFLFPLSADPTDFAHSERIAVVDKTGTVRGWFESAAPDLVASVTGLITKLKAES
jgi:cytochrome oxidase Cu insertion factor (SCO1/SenC/PrrC family)